MAERLQKIISAAGIASRRAAEAMILSGRVTVNGVTAELGQTADPALEEIRIDGNLLPKISDARTCIMLHKPRGYVTTLSDEKGRATVAELVQDAGKRLYPVGRLDYQSEGLLLMTDDGELANLLMHPSGEVRKTYRVEVSGDVDSALPILRSPLEIDGYRIRPAEVVPAGEAVLEITIHEGRNRQIRKMCELAGLKVRRLIRISEGSLVLGGLKCGQWRYLSENEIQMLKKSHSNPENE